MNKAVTRGLAAGAAIAVTVGISQLGWAADPQPSATPAPEKQQCGKCHGGGGDRFSGGPMEHRHGHGFPGRDGMHPGGLPFGMGPELKLTKDQIEKVKTILEGVKPQIEAIHKEEFEKMQAVMADAGKQIRPVLTEAQQAVFDDQEKLRQDSQALRDGAGK